MDRRKFIQYSTISTIGASLLAHKLPNYIWDQEKNILDRSSLTGTQQYVLYLTIPSVIGINFQHSVIVQIMKRMEAFFITLPVDRKEELYELFSLFDSGLFIKLITKTPIQLNDKNDAIELLNSWKYQLNHLILDNQLYVAYKSLCDLIFMGFYSTKQGHDLTRYKSFYESI